MTMQDEIDTTLSRKYQIQRWKLGLFWGFLNFTLALICYVDLQDGAISKYLISYSPLFWYIEFGLAVIFIINFVSDVGWYLWLRFKTPLTVKQIQGDLLGIRRSDDGFKTKAEEVTNVGKTAAQSPSVNFDPGLFFASSTPRLSGSSTASASMWSSSSPSSMIFDSSRMASTSASSWAYFDGSSATKHRRSFFNASMSPMNDEDVIADDKSIQHYLHKAEECVEQKLATSSRDSTHLNSSTANMSWAAQQSSLSKLNSFSSPKLSYQLSTRTPQSSTSRSEDTDASFSHHGEAVWSKIGVSSEQVFSWTENLRKWMSRTILSRIVSEIDSVNEALRRQGMPDVQIGEIGLAVLRQRAKGPQIPSLYALLQYLEVSSNQEYLVQRLKELEKGGCMSEFRWHAGGTFKGKPWSDSLPTDSAILMHFFFTYIDSQSPLHMSFPEGKPVTSRYFCKTPDKPALNPKDALCIYQTNVNPPHYKLVVREEILEIQKERNNLFHALLLFLYIIKTKEDGMLNYINLGPSGLNMLWIIQE